MGTISEQAYFFRFQLFIFSYLKVINIEAFGTTSCLIMVFATTVCLIQVFTSLLPPIHSQSGFCDIVGYVKERLRSSLRKFYGRYGDLTKQYEVPLSRMLHDILDDDHLQ